MDIMTFITIWVLLSFPIVHRVNTRMREAGEQIVEKVGFQLFLFVRAQFEVPRFYLINLINILLTKRN
jgi:predicted nucleic acid binding AN1-type Zn finger protein